MTATSFESRLSELLGINSPDALHAWLGAAFDGSEKQRHKARQTLDTLFGVVAGSGLGDQASPCREQLELALADSGVCLWELSAPAGSEAFSDQWRAMLWQVVAAGGPEGVPPEGWRELVHSDDQAALEPLLEQRLINGPVEFSADVRV